MPRLIIVTAPRPTAEDYIRGRVARLCDYHLDRLLLLSSLRCLIEPHDPHVWFVARAAQDESDRRGLIDGVRP